MLPLVAQRPPRPHRRRRPPRRLQRPVRQRPEELVVDHALARRSPRRRAAVGARRVELSVVIRRQRQPRPRVDPQGQPPVRAQLLEPGPELRHPVLGEALRLHRLPRRRRHHRPPGPQEPHIAVAHPPDEAQPVQVRHVDLPAPAHLSVRRRAPPARPRPHRPPRPPGRRLRLDRRRQERPSDRVRPVPRRRRPPHHLEPLHRPRVDREEVLVRPLSERAVVQPHPVEERHRLLPRHPAQVRRRLRVRRLLHIHPWLVAQRVRGRPRQPLLHLAPRHHRRRPLGVRRRRPLPHHRPRRPTSRPHPPLRLPLRLPGPPRLPPTPPLTCRRLRLARPASRLPRRLRLARPASRLPRPRPRRQQRRRDREREGEATHRARDCRGNPVVRE